jgi:hypothetical protein
MKREENRLVAQLSREFDLARLNLVGTYTTASHHRRKPAKTQLGNRFGDV